MTAVGYLSSYRRIAEHGHDEYRDTELRVLSGHTHGTSIGKSVPVCVYKQGVYQCAAITT